ncbi:MAG: hypothetical protein ACR2NJ_00310 [Acidimicrobiales bacterium]
MIAVFQGELGPCSQAKQPALFWPLLGASHGAETPGLYLHQEVLQDAFVHTGGRVIEPSGVALPPPPPAVRAIDVRLINHVGSPPTPGHAQL